MKCRRCGDRFEMRKATDRRCLRCEREVASITERPLVGFTPPWLARLTARDETRRAA